MLKNLPKELQREVFAYLDIQSIRFFGMTCKQYLQEAINFLKKRQLNLLSSPNLMINAGENLSLCCTPHTLYISGTNNHVQLEEPVADNTFFNKSTLLNGIILQIATSNYYIFILTDKGLYRYSTVDVDSNTALEKIEIPPKDIYQIVSGYYHAFILTEQQLYAYGLNNDGQLGLGHKDECETFTLLDKLPNIAVRQIAIGGCHTFLLTDQDLYACGRNLSGQLGLGHKNNCMTFTKLDYVPGIIQQIAPGGFHTVILTDQGFYACGLNTDGQLGLGHNRSCAIFTKLDLPSTIQQIYQIAAGGYHTVISTDQGLYVCGNNSFGQLGLDHKNRCLNFTKVEHISGKIQQIAAGDKHTLVMTDDGLYVCGFNQDGQLGLGHKDECIKFTKVKVLPIEIKNLFTDYQQIEKLKKLEKLLPKSLTSTQFVPRPSQTI